MNRCISLNVVRYVVPAAETTFSSIMSEPKSFAPNRSATCPTFIPIVTQDAWMFGTSSSTMRAIACVLRYVTASVFGRWASSEFSGCSGQQMKAVNPCVRRCTSRTRNRCSIRSAAVSPSPYIIVTDETAADRIEHLFRVREVQRRTHGFTAFICWPLQPENSELAHLPKTDAVTYLKTQAIARIVLEDVPNIQASWVTMGMKVGQVALRFGANDFGSLMMEENVVSAAGTTYRTTLSEMQRLIADAGYTPKQRRQDYTILEDAA